MKAHVGVDATSGLVHSVVGTAANVADVTQVDQLLHGAETYVSGDAGYTGAAKRPEHAERDVVWSIAARPSSYKHHGKDSVLYRVKRKVEYAKAQLRAKVDFSDPYYRAPARFVSRRDNVMPEIRPEYLEGKKVGVIGGTSHEAYLKAMFTDAEIHSYPDNDALRAALRRGEVDFIFGDAISLAFWINGTDSAECCAFSGGPFVESRYFGEGVGIAVRKGNDLLRQSLNWALFRIWEKGRFTDLWLRYFSISPF